MTDKPPNKKEITNDVLMADVMLRVTAMEQLLIEKGVFTQTELNHTTEEIAKKVAKVVLEKAQAAKSIDDFITSLSPDTDKKEFKN